jgi:hypothetical protein
MQFFRILLTAIVLSGSLYAAESPEKQLKTFIASARKALSKQPASTPRQSASDPLTPQASVSSLLVFLEQQATPLARESVQSAIKQVCVLLATHPKVVASGSALVAQLQSEHAQRIAQYRAEIDALLLRSTQACLDATTPAELDLPLANLTIYSRPADPMRQADIDPGAKQRILQMHQFVTRWQDYLGARQTGATDRAKHALLELCNLVDPTLILRSKLLTLLASNPEPAPPAPSARAYDGPASPTPANPAEPVLAAILARLEQADDYADLTPLAKDLALVIQANPAEPSIRALYDAVTGLRTDHENLTAGQVNTDLFFRNERLSALALNPRCSEPVLALLRRLTVQLQRDTLRMVFADSGLEQKPAESLDTYILRVAEAAASAENWEYTLRTLEFYCALFPDGEVPAWAARELQCSILYVTARQLDEAHQIAQAVIAYQDALRVVARLCPVELIKTRLALLKTHHPDAYKSALIIATNRPHQVYQPIKRQPPTTSPYRKEAPTYLHPRTERPFKP